MNLPDAFATRVALAPATAPDPRRPQKLLRIDPASGSFSERRTTDLPALLRPDDLVVLNDAATRPASIAGRSPRGGALEVRLIAALGAWTGPRWRAVLLGAGDWRTPTERRPAPDPVAPGDRLALAGGPEATVLAVDARWPRLVDLDLGAGGAALWSWLVEHGRPVQYAYLPGPLPLDAAQTPFAGPPWAMEMPSAGRSLGHALLAGLRARGVEVAWLTHATGPSATGDDALDAALPLPERYAIPARTAAAVARARGAGRRIVAIGTSVVRALEGAAAAGGVVAAGEGTTDLRLRPGFEPRVVAGLLSGLHEPGSSHRDLLLAFAPADLLDRALDHAARRGWLGHELGDACLVLP